MNPFELLKHDHKEVKGLFEKLQSGSRGAEKSRMDILDQIQEDLETHTAIEEEIFYPACEQHEELQSLISQAYEEHEKIDDLLTELSGLEPSDKVWTGRLRELQQAVDQHVRMEETQIFPKAQSVMDKGEIDELGKKLQTAKDKAA